MTYADYRAARAAIRGETSQLAESSSDSAPADAPAGDFWRSSCPQAKWARLHGPVPDGPHKCTGRCCNRSLPDLEQGD